MYMYMYLSPGRLRITLRICERSQPLVALRDPHGAPKDFTKAPTDNTTPRQTILSPNRLYKAPERL